MIVLLGCGHWFRESRPEGLAPEANGELRTCGHDDHYPNQYLAEYVKDDRNDR